MGQIIKAKPGKYKGVQYRSQLEIAWVRWMSDAMGKDFTIKYQDASDHDFIIHSNGEEPYLEWATFIEVKPKLEDVCAAALQRMRFSEYVRGQHWVLVIGSPPSGYGPCGVVRFDFCTCSDLYGPFEELGAYVRAGIMNNVGRGGPCDLCPMTGTDFDTLVIPSSAWNDDDNYPNSLWVNVILRRIAEESRDPDGFWNE